MKTELALIALLTLAGTALFFNKTNTLEASIDSTFEQYTAWKAVHGKTANGAEDQYRYSIWAENLKIVNAHNLTGSKMILGMNIFADMTVAEFAATKTTNLTKSHVDISVGVTATQRGAPDTWNWVDHGAVSPVKNQGNCGSCWAFSAVSQLEGLNAINSGNLEQFSEQQVTSCTPSPFSLGCNGGNSLFAFFYTAYAGIESESDYPYVQQTDPKTAACEYDESKVVFTNEGAGQVPANSPSDMQTQLLDQPLSIAVAAGNIYFQLYTGGVIDSEKCGNSLDHAISLVGYNQSGSNDFWIVRNSWGDSWGESGYANIQNSEGDGICGINMDVTYPTKVSA